MLPAQGVQGGAEFGCGRLVHVDEDYTRRAGRARRMGRRSVATFWQMEKGRNKKLRAMVELADFSMDYHGPLFRPMR